jgi:dTDP-4-amino-4,6-dideoxygalactose transaminase
MIPFVTLARQVQALRPRLMEAIAQVVDEQGFANGPAVARFEAALAEYVGVRHVVALNSGTSALHAALLCAGVSPGDEVITVAHTWVSTAWAVSYVGATPRFVDIDPRTCGMDPQALAAAVSGRARAILPVHLYGQPVELQPILDVAERNGIPVIEDAAQAIGARYRGRRVGSFGRVSATSFYPAKNLGAFGEGGALITDDPEIALRAARLRDHAQAGRHHHVELGFNWRMDGIQGAVLGVKLPLLDTWNGRRREIARRYRAALEGLPRLSTLAGLPDSEPIWHVFPVFHPERDALRDRLAERGVQCGLHYPTPVHLQPAYARLGLRRGALPHTEAAAASELSLPMFPELTDEEVERVLEAVQAATRELA